MNKQWTHPMHFSKKSVLQHICYSLYVLIAVIVIFDVVKGECVLSRPISVTDCEVKGSCFSSVSDIHGTAFLFGLWCSTCLSAFFILEDYTTYTNRNSQKQMKYIVHEYLYWVSVFKKCILNSVFKNYPILLCSKNALN